MTSRILRLIAYARDPAWTLSKRDGRHQGGASNLWSPSCRQPSRAQCFPSYVSLLFASRGYWAAELDETSLLYLNINKFTIVFTVYIYI